MTFKILLKIEKKGYKNNKRKEKGVTEKIKTGTRSKSRVPVPALRLTP